MFSTILVHHYGIPRDVIFMDGFSIRLCALNWRTFCARLFYIWFIAYVSFLANTRIETKQSIINVYSAYYT